jgi:hypothetical protein
MPAPRFNKPNAWLAASLALLWLLVGTAAKAVFTVQSAAVFGATFDINSRSASLADIDNDGDLDLFFQVDGTAHRLYRNDFVGSGTLTFTNITSSLPTGPDAIGTSWSAAWGDYDGDGFVDVFVGQTNSGTNGDVLHNNGAGGFTNATAATGLTDPGFHQNVAWNDIDNDRDLDLIISMEGPEKHEIYLQGPAGSFTKVGAAVGFQAALGTRGYGMAIGDSDGDGDLDVYISTCQPGGNVRNNFYKNMKVETGSLSFVDIADSNGTQYMLNSYGAEFHDFDNDSDLDLFMVGADGNPSKIWRNDGGNMFTDVDTITGHPLLSETGGDFNGSRAVDYDNDGDLDLFFHDRMSTPGNDFARKLYRNDGNWTFTDVTTAQGIHAVNQGAYDSTWGDLDRDGDQDLVAPTGSGYFERVFVSDASTNGNHWLYVELTGTSDNTTAVGASIYATIDTSVAQPLTLRREANTNAGTFNQSDLPVHFGLGSETSIDQMRIHWPDGTVQYLFDVLVDQYIPITYDGALPGDIDRDGDVDAADYVALRKGDNDLYTDADYQLWRRNFGRVAAGSGGSASIPEPANTAFLLACGGMLFRTRKLIRPSGVTLNASVSRAQPGPRAT